METNLFSNFLIVQVIENPLLVLQILYLYLNFLMVLMISNNILKYTLHSEFFSFFKKHGILCNNILCWLYFRKPCYKDYRYHWLIKVKWNVFNEVINSLKYIYLNIRFLHSFSIYNILIQTGIYKCTERWSTSLLDPLLHIFCL